MSIKSSVSFTDKHHEFARKKVEEGSVTSVSSLVALGIERLMQEEEEREIALKGLSEVIAQRMETPKEQWIEMNDQDSMFDKVLERIDTKK